ncbi:hypothetical protein ACHAWF_011997 [Thalassiosira exigua]
MTASDFAAAALMPPEASRGPRRPRRRGGRVLLPLVVVVVVFGLASLPVPSRAGASLRSSGRSLRRDPAAAAPAAFASSRMSPQLLLDRATPQLSSQELLDRMGEVRAEVQEALDAEEDPTEKLEEWQDLLLDYLARGGDPADLDGLEGGVASYGGSSKEGTTVVTWDMGEAPDNESTSEPPADGPAEEPTKVPTSRPAAEPTTRPPSDGPTEGPSFRCPDVLPDLVPDDGGAIRLAEREAHGAADGRTHGRTHGRAEREAQRFADRRTYRRTDEPAQRGSERDAHGEADGRTDGRAHVQVRSASSESRAYLRRKTDWRSKSGRSFPARRRRTSDIRRVYLRRPERCGRTCPTFPRSSNLARSLGSKRHRRLLPGSAVRPKHIWSASGGTGRNVVDPFGCDEARDSDAGPRPARSAAMLISTPCAFVFMSRGAPSRTTGAARDEGTRPSNRVEFSAPTFSPTFGPTTAEPSASPGERPTNGPTDGPTEEPSKRPTGGPTDEPTREPSVGPSASPSAAPEATLAAVSEAADANLARFSGAQFLAKVRDDLRSTLMSILRGFSSLSQHDWDSDGSSVDSSLDSSVGSSVDRAVDELRWTILSALMDEYVRGSLPEEYNDASALESLDEVLEMVRWTIAEARSGEEEGEEEEAAADDDAVVREVEGAIRSWFDGVGGLVYGAEDVGDGVGDDAGNGVEEGTDITAKLEELQELLLDYLARGGDPAELDGLESGAASYGGSSSNEGTTVTWDMGEALDESMSEPPTKVPTSRPTEEPTTRPLTDGPTEGPSFSVANIARTSPTLGTADSRAGSPLRACPLLASTGPSSSRSSPRDLRSPHPLPTHSRRLIFVSLFLCDSPTFSPTSYPTTEEPSASPSVKPTVRPTDGPTDGPTDEPSARPSGAPTEDPTDEPTRRPSAVPSRGPTDGPTGGPTSGPTDEPTSRSSPVPSEMPTAGPTDGPTFRCVSASSKSRAFPRRKTYLQSKVRPGFPARRRRRVASVAYALRRPEADAGRRLMFLARTKILDSRGRNRT